MGMTPQGGVGKVDRMSLLYVQPIAQHGDHPERLLLQGEDGCVYVWLGEDPNAAPEEIAPATAAWLLTLPCLDVIPAPRVWFQATDLPVVARVV